jgi:hypothetical protein
VTAHSRHDAKSKLDALIDWDALHRPGSTEPIHVALSPTALGKLIGKVPRKGSLEMEYRGRRIICTALDTLGQRFLGGVHK